MVKPYSGADWHGMENARIRAKERREGNLREAAIGEIVGREQCVRWVQWRVHISLYIGTLPLCADDGILRVDDLLPSLVTQIHLNSEMVGGEISACMRHKRTL